MMVLGEWQRTSTSTIPDSRAVMVCEALCSAWSVEFLTWSLEFLTWSLEFLTWSLEFLTWSLLLELLLTSLLCWALCSFILCRIRQFSQDSRQIGITPVNNNFYLNLSQV